MNLSSDDIRVHSLLERFDLERVRTKSSDTLLIRIAGEASDEQFLEAASLDGPGRNRIAHDLLKLEQSLIDVNVADIFNQSRWPHQVTRA